MGLPFIANIQNQACIFPVVHSNLKPFDIRDRLKDCAFIFFILFFSWAPGKYCTHNRQIRGARSDFQYSCLSVPPVWADSW